MPNNIQKITNSCTMDRERSVIVDSYQISPKIVDRAFKSAKNQNKSHLVLAETFRMMNLNKLYESNPGDQSVKQAIKGIADSDFLPRGFEEETAKNPFDLTELFPLNKTGNFGRVLNRKCKLADKGIMQFSDNQTPKLKQIKSFVNRVQTIGFGGNDNKIEWYEQSTKYPYRIVLIDINDGHKAIYFSTPEKAEKVRIVLVQKYLYKGNFGSVINSLNRSFLNSTAEQLKNKLISRQKMISKSNRFSRNVALADSIPPMESRVNNVDPSVSVFNRQKLFPQSLQNSYFSQPSDALKVSGMLQSKTPNKLFDNINQKYMTTFLTKWLQKANLKGSSLNKSVYTPIQNDKYSRVNPNPSDSIYKSRIDNFNERSSNKQESIFNRLAENNTSNIKKSEFKEKESYVKQFGKDQFELNEELHFYSIEFLTLTNLFFKPIVTIEMVRNGKVEQYVLYNTVIKKKDPVLTYDLIKNKEEEQNSHLILGSSLKEYEIVVKVIDFLANEEVINDRLTMKNKRIIGKSILLCDNKMVRLEFGFKKTNEEENSLQGQIEIEPVITELRVPPLSEGVKEKINQFWERESQFQGYYSQTNLSMFKILSQIEIIPLTWWKGMREDEYELVQVVYSASKILGFKMIRSFPHIIKVFVALYPNVQELTEKLLSFILTFLKTYYFPQHMNRIQKFHKILGLQSDCELMSKVSFQILTIEKMVSIECPALFDKLNRSNVTYGHQVIQYIYEAFSRNFTPNCLVQIWNTLFEDLQLLQLNMILFSVSLIKHFQQDLIPVKRLSEFCRVMQSKKINKIQHIICSMNNLKEKYFGEVRGFLDEIKNIFNSKPLEPVLEQFYKNETAKMDRRKHQKSLQKKTTLRKVNRQIDIQFPEYPSQQYTLHIYFSTVPSGGGSLTIRCRDIDYECLNLQKNRYFIIGQVSSTLTLVFLDLKSVEFTCELVLNQGIQEHTAYLTSQKNSTLHKIQYIGGLLTDSQIEMFKRGKKIDHFISPFIKEIEFREQMNRPLSDTYFLKKYDNANSKDDLVKKIKSLFCQGNKTFNQIQFYIEQIQTSDLTIEQKINLVKTLAQLFSLEFCLCKNQIIEKHFIRLFLQSAGFELNAKQYECFYNDSLEYEFDAPKILKCRYYPQNQSNKEIKLESEALNYFIFKCSNYLYCDIIVDDLIQAVKPSINEQLGKFAEGELKLYYSSNGEVFLKSWQLKYKNNKKDIDYQQIKSATAESLEVREMRDPQILMTEVLPSFAKISTILDYVNTNRHIDLKHKYEDKEKRKIAENINILKDCQSKFNKAIMMRHLCYPKTLHIPFFNYYYELTHQFSTPVVKNIVLNNLKSDLKAVCLFGGQLKYGENAKIDTFSYRDDIGLYGNLRLMSKDAKGWFFFGSVKDDFDQKKESARVFVNYGYGIFRWEQCQVLGFYRRSKSNRNSSSKASKPKKEYLIIRRNQEKTVKQYELQISLEALARIEELFDSQSRLSRQERTYGNDDQEESMSGNLKYLSKFVK